jgi:DNA repair exonuclease SbcCD ATPase subunit
MDESAGEWCTYEQAGERLRVSPAAVRARALRGGWRRMGENDGKARVLLTQDVVRAAAEQPREQPRKAPIAELASALRAHVETLKGDVARLEVELTHAQANADRATAELKTDIERLTAELAGERAARQADQEQLAVERAARQADQEQHQEQLAAERTARQTDQEHAAARQADQEQQIAAARAAADRATAELVELARRLAEIAEKQTSAETAAAEPEPPRRSAAGRAWRWFLRN